MSKTVVSNKNKLYINGQWVASQFDKNMQVINPATKEVLAEVASANKQDAEKTITAARDAFDHGPWRSYTSYKRADLLNQIAKKIEGNKEELSRLETENNGKTLRESLDDMDSAIKTFQYYAGLCFKPYGETLETEDPFTSKVVREPIGVCAQIIPWNYPLLMASWKLAPALAAGNTCILKPSEITPLTAIRLFELIDECGFPPGVVNLLIGTGADAGQPLAESSQIDKVAFTGGVETGKNIMVSAVGNLKKVSLELGGKSPNIVFADADFETAVDHAIFAIFNNTGQVCSAGSRLLVEKSIYSDFVNEVARRTKKIRVGNGLDENSQVGPLVSQDQLEKTLNYIEIGKEEGATIVAGGKRLSGLEYDKGYFVEPTVFTNVDSKMRIAQEEIFGPVLCVIPFKNELEALQLANDTPYGLAAGIFTKDGAKAERMANNIRAGVTWINTYEQNLIEGPWGGFKQSGVGRELGTYGLEEYTEVKQIINNLKVEPTGWFDK